MRIRNLVVSAALMLALAIPASSYAYVDSPSNPCPPGLLCEDSEPATDAPADDTKKEDEKKDEKKEEEPVKVSVGVWIPKITAPKECPTCWGGSITIRF